MYGRNEYSRETIYEVVSNNKKLKEIIKVVEITWEEGYKIGEHGRDEWTYNGMLRDFGLKIEGKEGRKLKAGSLMYKNAEKMNMVELINDIIVETRKLGIKKGYVGAEYWTVDGLLQSLGDKIEDIVGFKIPKHRDDTYHQQS